MQTPPDPMIGKTLAGKYRVVQLLGEGGMGSVYVGEQQLGNTTRRVAIKTLHLHLSQDQKVRERFNREAGTMASLEHPNTVAVFDFGASDDGHLYIVMEFVQGRAIADVIAQEKALAPARVAKIIEQIGGSLAEAHAKGIIHRDLKPDNVVLTERAGQKDFVKVLDFGIAKRSTENDPNEKKLTQQGMVLGTPPYMSPEQFTGQPLDARSDIYSLAVMAYEMLTGTLPFEASNAWEWATLHMTAAPKPLEAAPNGASLPPAMRDAVMAALSKDPSHRPPTVENFVDRFCGRAAAPPEQMQQKAPTAGMQAPPPAAGGDPLKGKTMMGEPLAGPPPDAFLANAPPVNYGPPPAAPAVPAYQQQSYGHVTPPGVTQQRARGGGGNKALLLAVAAIVGIFSIGAIVVGSGVLSDGSSGADVPPPNFGSTGATATTEPTPTTTETAPPQPTVAPTLGGTPPPPQPLPTTKPTTAPPKPTPTPQPTPAPTPTPTPQPTPTPPPQPTPQPTPIPTPPPTPIPTPPPPKPTPPTPPQEPKACADARRARAQNLPPAVVRSLETQCRAAGGTP